ncbi:MAG: DUF3307 domain-containing protein [Micavibrio aeruginosavorus]|uniref:DUF3307 domain-containing protein n=1 Tax=Micavibrio aeruginosavorus TaxID=349221 RepID=A0A2W5Q1S1_9BACT|nr:MAG: DUF3307 domain-containing protein [Micavibrio aeruginosavorus]
MTPLSLILLYSLFRLKHFVCDYALQTNWIALNKGLSGRQGWQALLLHTLGQAIGTTLVTVVFAPALWWLGLVDFAVHTAIDLCKARLTHKMGWTPKDRWFWLSIGLDQEAHNFTHLAYIVIIYVTLTGGL